MANQNLLDRLREINPKRNVLFTAIEKVNNPGEIKQFYREYIEYLRTECDDAKIRENAEQVANSNIGYVVGYYCEETARKWMNALPRVRHPVFGRENPFSAEGAVKAYELGKKCGQILRRQ